MVESQDVGQHPQVARAERVALLHEELTGRGAVVLEGRLVTSNTEAHFARQRVHAKLVQQPDEIRISPVVKDNESRIDRQRIHLDGIRVAADIGVGFEYGDVVALI